MEQDQGSVASPPLQESCSVSIFSANTPNLNAFKYVFEVANRMTATFTMSSSSRQYAVWLLLAAAFQSMPASFPF